MKTEEVKRLINQVEENFRTYYTLFHPLAENPNILSNSEDIEKLKSFLFAVTAYEEEIIEFRLKKIIKEEHPYLPPIYPDKFKNHFSTQNEPLAETVEKFLKQRQELVKLLYGTPAVSWSRTGVDEETGHVTFEEIVRMLLKKDRDNLSFIKNILPG